MASSTNPTIDITPTALWNAVNTDTDIAMFTTVMEHRFAWRDAVIVLALDPALGADDFVMLAEHAHDPCSRSIMDRVLAGAFRGHAVIDADRARRIAHRLAEAGHTKRAVNPLAAAAYLDWAVGMEDEAIALAGEALGINPRHTLSMIVLSAIDHGIHADPATRN